MKIYLVGGAVRNEVLGLPIKDNDYVVVGSTKEEMLSKGFKLVGADFPVFLDAEGNEYALARKERSTGTGYNDFEVTVGPDMVLDSDIYKALVSMGYDPEGEYPVEELMEALRRTGL